MNVAQSDSVEWRVTLLSISLSDDSPGSGFTFFTPLPVYPFYLWRAGIGGRVAVRIKVSPEGVVEQAWVTKSTFSEFDPVVLRAVEGWRFIEIPSPFTGLNQGLLFDCEIEFGGYIDGVFAPIAHTLLLTPSADTATALRG